MSDTTIDDIDIQTAMPEPIPEFEGIRPVGVVTRVNGTGERITRGMHLGERGVLVVEYEVSNVGHGRTAQGVKRIQTLGSLDLFELEGRAGQRILNALRQAHKASDDLRHGRADLLGEHAGQAGWKMTPDGWTDSTGRLLSDEELAEIRGTLIEKAANDPQLDPVALVFSDGSRTLWPDDYPAGTARPWAADFVGELQVREVLDGMTGEQLAVWTEDDEDERLRLLEEAAAAEEAAGDRDAFAEVLAGRGESLDDDPFVGLPGDDGKEIGPLDPGEPIDGYEHLSAKEVRDRLLAMTDRDAVFAVATWEEDHGGRKTIIEAAGRRAAELLG